MNNNNGMRKKLQEKSFKNKILKKFILCLKFLSIKTTARNRKIIILQKKKYSIPVYKI